MSAIQESLHETPQCRVGS